MIKNLDKGNVDSRRAFSIDSRTTWVESAHSGADHHVVSKDNRVLGPGEYTPQLQSYNRKHVPGPLLGGSRGIVDHFHPFRSLLSIKTPSKGGGGGKGLYGGGSISGNSMVTWEDSAYGTNTGDSYFAQNQPVYTISNDISRNVRKKEGCTIFHEHDRRIAIDPNTRTTPTPGSYLNHESLLRSTSTFCGVRDLPSTVKMGPDDIPFGDRIEIRPAAPGDYKPEKCYDSKHLRKQIKQIKISPTERVTYFDIQAREIEIQNGVISPVSEHKMKRDQNATKIHSDIAIAARAEANTRKDRIKSIRMPTLRTRKPPGYIFDSTCYNDAKKEAMDLPLNPASLKREAKIDLFNDYIALPRKHQGHRMTSKLSDKVKRSVF